jgi:hypothetical protein
MVAATAIQQPSTHAPGVTPFFSICYTALAEFLGSAEQALLLQRIHYWLQNQYSGYLLTDGTKWTFNGYKEIQQQFPWLSIDQIGRCIRRLEAIGWLKSSRFYNLNRQIGFIHSTSGFHEDNQRKWYRLNYQQIYEDTGFDLLFAGDSSSIQPKRRKTPKRANVQSCTNISATVHEDICKNADSSIYKEFQTNSKHLSCESEQFLQISEQQNVGSYPSSQETLNDDKEVTPSLTHLDENQCSAPSRTSKQRKSSHCRDGFESRQELDDFYQALIELGKNTNVEKPSAWAGRIVKSVNAGDPCEYLAEFRRGEQVGTCDKAEWEAQPGVVYPKFESYLRSRLKLNHLSPEQTTSIVRDALRDRVKGRMLWQDFLHSLVHVEEERRRLEDRGVQGHRLPPELQERGQVSVEQAAGALQEFVENSLPQVGESGQDLALPGAMTGGDEKAAAMEASVSSEATGEPSRVELSEEEETQLSECDDPVRRKLLETLAIKQNLWRNVPKMRDLIIDWVKQTPEVTLGADGPELINSVADGGVASESVQGCEEHSPVLDGDCSNSAESMVDCQPTESDEGGSITPTQMDDGGLVPGMSEDVVGDVWDDDLVEQIAGDAATGRMPVANSSGDVAQTGVSEVNELKPLHYRFIGRQVTGLIDRKLCSIEPDTVVVLLDDQHSRPDLCYVRPASEDWSSGIAVRRVDLIDAQPRAASNFGLDINTIPVPEPIPPSKIGDRALVLVYDRRKLGGLVGEVVCVDENHCRLKFPNGSYGDFAIEDVQLVPNDGDSI